MPHRELDFHAVDGLFLLSLGREELTKQSFVVGVGEAHLAGLHVLPLRVIDALLGDDLATDKQHTLDLEVGLFAEHANLTEGELSEGFKSLEETFEQVLELVCDLSFLTELVVVEPPECPALTIKLSQELIKAFSLLIRHIDVVGLEVEEVEASGRQSIKWVLRFLLFLLGGRFWLSSSRLGLLLLFLWFLWKLRWLQGLLADFDKAESTCKWRELSDPNEPSCHSGHPLLET